MHVHACYHDPMRTTVEIKDENRAKLLKLAAERGEKGFSAIVDEALERYFSELEERAGLIRAAVGVLGELDDEAGEALERSVRQLRERWR
jgi:predicted ATP-dependent protease